MTVRRVCAALICVALSIVAAATTSPASAATLAPDDGISWFSAKGLGWEWVSQGRYYLYAGTAISFGISGSKTEIRMGAQAESGSWSAFIDAPRGGALGVGTFSTTRYAGDTASGPVGMDIGGMGRGCDRSHGHLTIRQFDLDPATGSLERLEATYEQFCENSTHPLVGEFALHATVRPPTAAGLAGVSTVYAPYGSIVALHGFGRPGTIARLHRLVGTTFTSTPYVVHSGATFLAHIPVTGDTRLRVVDESSTSALTRILVRPTFDQSRLSLSGDRSAVVSGTGLPRTTLQLMLSRASQGIVHHATRAVRVGANGTWRARVQFAGPGRARVQAVSAANHVRSSELATRT